MSSFYLILKCMENEILLFLGKSRQKVEIGYSKNFHGTKVLIFIHNLYYNASNITKFFRFIKLNLASMFYLELKNS